MNDAQNDIDFFDFIEEKNEIQIFSDDTNQSLKPIEAYYGSITKLALVAEAIRVTDVTTSKVALDLTSEVKNTYRSIEEYRKKITDPSRKFIQIVNDCAKGVQKQLDSILEKLSNKLAAYQALEEKKAQEAQEKIQKISEELGLEIPLIAPEPMRNIESSKATSYTKEYLSFEITDASLVPDEYWKIDESAIQKHIDLGKREIPGVKIVKEKKFFIRRK